VLDNEFYISKNSHVSLVSLTCPVFEEHKTMDDTLRSLGELQELTKTLGLTYIDQFVQKRPAPDPATIIGKGKLEEIAEEAKNNGSDLLVFDCELTSSQIRNIKKVTGLSVVDRIHIILEIFARHAHTKQAKIQIEIARLKYILPRLSGFWSHLGRQRGGVGVLGGEGEQQIELDRRIIRERIEFLKRGLKDVSKSRQQQKKKRSNQAIVASLVGYTNAGKSSLMNRLCQVDVLEEDKLFATLDSTHRMLTPDTKPPMILVDTVGFISNLPNTLIDGFKTTLESAIDSDLLLIVCDISNPHFEKHLSVTETVLAELEISQKDRIIVFNKKDLLKDPFAEKIIRRKYPNSFVVSSFEPEDVKSLREHVIGYFLDKQDSYDLFIPYQDGNSHSKVLTKTNVRNSHNHEKGIFYRVKIPSSIFNPLGLNKYVLSPDTSHLPLEDRI
jgi:GTP-binding protein HflX